MRNSLVKRNSRRIVCFIAAILIAATFSACKKGGSISHISPSSVTADTTTAVSPAPTTAATTAVTAAAAAGDITVGWSTDDGVRIRAGAGLDYKGIGGLHKGEKVSILGKEGDWYKIKFSKSDNGFGYVSAQYISSTEVASDLTAAATTAAATAAAQ